MDWKGLIAILFVGLLLFGCTQYGSGPSASPSGPSSSGSGSSGSDAGTGHLSASTASGSVDAAQEITMTAKQFEFDPNVITVKKGQKVIIHLSSPDTAHSFAAPDFNVNVRVDGGGSSDVEFTPDKAGTFSFFCAIPCGPGHKAMRGRIVVTE